MHDTNFAKKNYILRRYWLSFIKYKEAWKTFLPIDKNYSLILFIWNPRTLLHVLLNFANVAIYLENIYFSFSIKSLPVHIVFNGAYYSLVEFSIHTFTKGVTPAWFPVVIQFVLVGFLSCHAYVTKPCNILNMMFLSLLNKMYIQSMLSSGEMWHFIKIIFFTKLISCNI